MQVSCAGGKGPDTGTILYLKSRVRGVENEKDDNIFHPLIHSPNGYKC